MSDTHRFPVLTAILALLLLSTEVCYASINSNSSSSFDSQPMCPTGAADWSVLGAPVTSVTRPNACIVECALRPNCSAVHYNQTAGSCWPALSWQWQDRWQNAASADCLAFIKRPNPAEQLPASLLSSLALWYNFRYSLSNLAGNASSQSIAASLQLGAVRDSSGVVLNSSSESHAALTIPGGGFESLYSTGGRFSVYAKVYRRPRAQEVSYLQTVESGKSVTFLTEGTDGRFTVGCRAYVNQKQTTVQPVLKSPIAAGTVSVGFSYDGSAFRVFNNASLYGTTSNGNVPAASAGTEVRIGGRLSDASATLDGRVLCFGLATKALGMAEFSALEDACS